MSILPVELRNTTDGARAAREIEGAMRAARRRLGGVRTLEWAASTLAIPVALCALWIGLSRFTLLDLPQWPILLFILGWLVALFIVAGTRTFTPGECARFLDRSLSLDERVTTVLEMARATPLKSLAARTIVLPKGLLLDTAFHIKARKADLPSALSYRPARWQPVAVGVALVALIACIILPTELDSVRAERAALQRTLDVQLNEISTLKAEVVARPGLTDADRQNLLAQLDDLQSSLSSTGLDRSAMLAALSQAQQGFQQLSPQTTADFDNILAAARSTQQAVIDASVASARSTAPGAAIDLSWSPADYPGLDDLQLAANAANTLANQSRFLSSNQTRDAVNLLSQASTQAAPDDADLGQHLLDSSNAINAKDVEKAQDALVASAQSFLSQDERFQLTQSVDKIMSNLDQGRQSLAQAGAPTSKRPQVGFRRPNAQAAANTTPATGQPNDPGGQSNRQSDQNDQNPSQPSAFGPQLGGASPLYGASNNGSTNSPSNGSGGGAGGGQNGNQQTGSTSGQTGTSGGSNGSQQAGGGQSSSGGGPSTLTGPISGPVGGAGGAISQVPNPAGQGVGDGSTGSSAQTSGDQQDDSIYIPPSDQNAVSSAAPPAQGTPQQGGIAGRSSSGGDGAVTPSDQGQGSRNQIHTPYKQVIGNYAQQASQALDSAYVPPDARDYVKNYFTQLGK